MERSIWNIPSAIMRSPRSLLDLLFFEVLMFTVLVILALIVYSASFVFSVFLLGSLFQSEDAVSYWESSAVDFARLLYASHILFLFLRGASDYLTDNTRQEGPLDSLKNDKYGAVTIAVFFIFLLFLIPSRGLLVIIPLGFAYPFAVLFNDLFSSVFRLLGSMTVDYAIKPFALLQLLMEDEGVDHNLLIYRTGIIKDSLMLRLSGILKVFR